MHNTPALCFILRCPPRLRVGTAPAHSRRLTAPFLAIALPDCGSFFYNSEVTTWGKTALSVLVVIVNIAVVCYFVVNIASEVFRTTLDLEEIHREEILHLLETKAWPAVAYAKGRAGAAAKYVFLRLVLVMEKRVTRRWAAGSLARTRARLDATLHEVVRTANWRERLRRSTNVTNWVLLGLVQTLEVAQLVADYEGRGRSALDPLWEDIVAESQAHRAAMQQALIRAKDAEGVRIFSGRDRKIGRLLGPGGPGDAFLATRVISRGGGPTPPLPAGDEVVLAAGGPGDGSGSKSTRGAAASVATSAAGGFATTADAVAAPRTAGRGLLAGRARGVGGSRGANDGAGRMLGSIFG